MVVKIYIYKNPLSKGLAGFNIVYIKLTVALLLPTTCFCLLMLYL